VADRVPASSASSATALASFNYTAAKPSVDPIGDDFFNILLVSRPANIFICYESETHLFRPDKVLNRMLEL
jgi:hypothetical protein